MLPASGPCLNFGFLMFYGQMIKIVLDCTFNCDTTLKSITPITCFIILGASNTNHPCRHLVALMQYFGWNLEGFFLIVFPLIVCAVGAYHLDYVMSKSYFFLDYEYCTPLHVLCREHWYLSNSLWYLPGSPYGCCMRFVHRRYLLLNTSLSVYTW